MRSWLLTFATLAVVALAIMLRSPGGAPATTPAVAVAPPRSARADPGVVEGPGTRERIEADVGSAASSQRVRVHVTIHDGDPAAKAMVGPCADGTAVVADHLGVAALDVTPSSRVWAHLGDGYGEAVAQPDERDVHIVLDRDVTLRVQVVDTDGRPQSGFDVVARVVAQSRRAGPRDDSQRLPPTAADGMTVLPHAQVSLTMPGLDVVAWQMVLRCELGDGIERTVAADELRAGAPIRIVVPAGGDLAVDVVDADGKWLWASVSLAEAEGGGMRASDACDGVDWFRQLPLGRSWIVCVRSFGVDVRQPVVGPAEVDQVVRVRVAMPLRGIAIQGRLVRADGMPVPGARLELAGPSLRLHHDGRSQTRDGSVGGRVGEFHFGGALPADVGVVEGVTLRAEHEPRLATVATVTLPPLGPGDHDLGDLVVPVPPDEVLLASVAVRHEGRDVTAEAWAYLQAQGDRHVNSLSVFTHHRGDRIAFHGPRTDRPLVVGCWSRGGFAHGIPIRMGEDRVIELESAATLVVHLLAPPVPFPLLNAELRRSDGLVPGCSRTGDGFAWRGIATGRYRLRIFVRGQVLHEVPALDLVAGSNVWPAAGGSLDLCRSARAHHLDVRDDVGRTIDACLCAAIPAGSAAPPGDFEPRRLRREAAQWFVPSPSPVDLVIVAAGFVPIRIPAPTADTQILLQRCTMLRVATAPGEVVRTIVRVVTDAVRDPWLRTLDVNPHEVVGIDAQDEPEELHFAPGTIVDVVVERDGVEGIAQRVTIGPFGPIDVTAR